MIKTPKRPAPPPARSNTGSRPAPSHRYISTKSIKAYLIALAAFVAMTILFGYKLHQVPDYEKKLERIGWILPAYNDLLIKQASCIQPIFDHPVSEPPLDWQIDNERARMINRCQGILQSQGFKITKPQKSGSKKRPAKISTPPQP